MDMPWWVISAIVGAVSGAIGAGVGWLAERAGLKVGRYIVILFVVGGLSLSRTPAVQQIFQRATWTDTQTVASLRKAAPDLYAYLETAFPSDYADIVSASTNVVRTAGNEAAGEKRSAELMEALRRKYAKFIRFASDSDLYEFLNEQIKFYSLVLGNEGPAACTKLALEGPMGFLNTGFSERYAAALADQVLALFRAARGGIDAPVARRTPTDDDWAVDRRGRRTLLAG